jgi:hypothetical protein
MASCGALLQAGGERLKHPGLRAGTWTSGSDQRRQGQRGSGVLLPGNYKEWPSSSSSPTSWLETRLHGGTDTAQHVEIAGPAMEGTSWCSPITSTPKLLPVPAYEKRFGAYRGARLRGPRYDALWCLSRP